MIFFFKQKTAYEVRISDWSSDVCSSDLLGEEVLRYVQHGAPARRRRLLAEAEEGERRLQDDGGGDGERRLHQHRRENVGQDVAQRSEEHTSELQSLMRISYAVFCLKKKNTHRPFQVSHSHTGPSHIRGQ